MLNYSVIIKDMKVMFLRDFVYYVELFIVENKKCKQNYSFFYLIIINYIYLFIVFIDKIHYLPLLFIMHNKHRP